MVSASALSFLVTLAATCLQNISSLITFAPHRAPLQHANVQYLSSVKKYKAIHLLASEKSDGSMNLDDPISTNEVIIVRGDENDEIDESVWEELEDGEPPKLLVMKELLGVNVFTYILAGLIIFFLGMNLFAGPGWLGAMAGIPGTGALNGVSDSIPAEIDLNDPAYKI